MANPLIKLPPMPKAPSATRAPREAQECAQPLCPLPPMSKFVTPRNPQLEGVGRWFETTDRQDEWGGTCCACGGAVRAIDLSWAIGPFNRWQGWACRDCRKDVKIGSRDSAGRKYDKPEQKMRKRPIYDVNRERYLSWEVERAEYETNWENEGGSI